MHKPLMVSTSGIRGVVGPILNPVVVARYVAAFGTYLKKGKVVVGRDSRPSGIILKETVIAALRAVGRNVIDIGLVPTPTVEIAVTGLKAAGGICLTASHNPAEWNALKFFGKTGEFIDKSALEKIKAIEKDGKFAFAAYNKLGKLTTDSTWIERHISDILRLKIINRAAIKKARLKVIVDAINGAGSFALPELLERLGIRVVRVNCKGDGDFTHEPEPVPHNLAQLARAVKKHKAHLGMACDPDADRLALVDEKGRPIGEELTLALAVKFVLAKRRGNVVVNLSTSRVTEEAALMAGEKIFYTPVGEANVIAGIRKHKAVIGGEGNGGVIYPGFHAGRDALVGAAMIVSLLAEGRVTLSQAAGSVPEYFNIKSKAALPRDFEKNIANLEKVAQSIFTDLRIDRRDGLRFDFSRGWFQVRKSNTEPIYRLIVETDDRRQIGRAHV